jgi:hypothetical protein
VSPRAGLDACGKSRPQRDSIPAPSSPQRVAVPTDLSQLTYYLDTYDISVTTAYGISNRRELLPAFVRNVRTAAYNSGKVLPVSL